MRPGLSSEPSSSAADALPRIAYLASVFPKRSETFVYREVRGLRQRGAQVTCVTLRPSDSAPLDGADLVEGLVTVYSSDATHSWLKEVVAHPGAAFRTTASALLDAFFPEEPMGLGARARLFLQAQGGIRLADTLRARRVEHIHAHFAHAPTSIAMYAAMQMSIPFSFTGHANDIFERRSLLRKKLRRSKFVSCISEWHRNFYLAQEPVETKLHVIRCGVDTDAWCPADATARETDIPLRLSCVCRLVEKKGVDLLLRALPLVNCPVTLTIAGDGPEEDTLKELCRELSLADRVTFLGAVENAEARKIVQHSDAFVMPCRTDKNGDKDGIPVVFMESMACEVPVISGNLPAILELVEDEKNGLILHREGPAELARLIERLAQPEARQLGQRARQRVVEEFSLAETIARLCRHFSTPVSSQS